MLQGTGSDVEHLASLLGIIQAGKILSHESGCVS